MGCGQTKHKDVDSPHKTTNNNTKASHKKSKKFK